MARLSENKYYRLLEIIPGALVWLTFIGALALSFFSPLLAIYLIILFDLYWLVKAIYWLVYLFSSYRNFRRDTKIDWLVKLQNENPRSADGFANERIYHLIFLST